MATKPKPKPLASWYIVPFTTRRGFRQRHYFRLVATNGKTIAQSEGYSRATDRDSTAQAIAEPAGAEIRFGQG